MSRLWLLPLALLVACSTEEVDTARVEGVVERQLGRQAGDRVDVRCPEGVAWEPGEDFHCVARDSVGQTRRVTVTMENDAGDITWNLD